MVLRLPLNIFNGFDEVGEHGETVGYRVSEPDFVIIVFEGVFE